MAHAEARGSVYEHSDLVRAHLGKLWTKFVPHKNYKNTETLLKEGQLTFWNNPYAEFYDSYTWLNKNVHYNTIENLAYEFLSSKPGDGKKFSVEALKTTPLIAANPLSEEPIHFRVESAMMKGVGLGYRKPFDRNTKNTDNIPKNIETMVLYTDKQIISKNAGDVELDPSDLFEGSIFQAMINKIKKDSTDPIYGYKRDHVFLTSNSYPFIPEKIRG